MPHGLKPVLYMTYVGLGGSTDGIARWGKRTRDELATLEQKDVILQIGLSFVGGKDTGHALDGEVASGARDAELKEFCSQLASFERSSFVRIGYEFNGHWNGYKPETYKLAFERITAELRRTNPRAATVWCAAPSTGRPLLLSDILEFLPRPETVDWWGVDVFNVEDLAPGGLVDAFCAEAAARGWPVMIGESTPRLVGAVDGTGAWEKWFKGYFALIERNPSIKAFCYINWDWRYWSNRLGFKWHNWGDARIEGSPLLLQQYLKEIKKPMYAHSAG